MVEEKKYYQMSSSELFENFDTSGDGLSEEEAKERLEKYGKNELQAKLKTPKWLLLLSQFRELLVLVLIVAGVLSILIGSYKTAIAMFIIVIINAIIGFIQEYKAENILERLKELVESPAKVVRDGELVEVSQDKLVPGDIIKVEEGDKIPADIRIIESLNLRTNDFSLTGESMPQDKYVNALEDVVSLADRNNMAYVGTTVASGSATGLVVATGMDTEMGKVTDLTQKTGEIKSPLQKELDNLARKLTGIVIVISGSLLLFTLWQGFSTFTSMIYAIGIAVSSVPQALPAQVTVALSTGSKRLADKNAVVKSLPSVETLGSTTVICTDKTGTLTKNEMTVRSMWFNGEKFELTGTGYEPEGEIRDEEGESLSQEEIDEIEILMDSATMASNAEVHEPDEEHDRWYPIGDPTEAAIITASRKIGTRSPQEDEENPEIQEFSFDHQRKRMSSAREIRERYSLEKISDIFGNKRILAMKGATDSVLSVSKYIYKDGEVQPITEEDKDRVREMNRKYSEKAMRVLAIAYRPLEESGDYEMEEVEKEVVFLGLIAMIDPPKEGVSEAIKKAHEAHVRTFIMTGDHATTARAVAEEIGLSGTAKSSKVVTGKELKEMSDEELAELMKENESLIFSRVDPEDKLKIVDILESQEEVVAVTGDGVNDAPALKKAHIGVAMGKKGTDVAKEASELVLLDDSYPTLVDAVREGRTIYSNLRKTVLASMTTNGAELVTVLLGLFSISLLGWSTWALPILVIQILAIDLLAEIMPLTFLTYDPPSEYMMKSPPRSLKEHIINKFTGTEVILLGTLIGALAFGNFWFFAERAGIQLTVGSRPAVLYAMATTTSYLTIAFCQFLNILSRRYDYTSIFNRNILGNKILLGSIFASIGLVLLGIYGPYISDFLSFGSIGLTDWLYVFLAALAYLAVFEILKIFKRWRENPESKRQRGQKKD
uniref:Calcium-translocating P-type ATPase, PMCA-type n=1 Tax=uncultured organism TaxID=155900 RepID=M1Q2E3_9ZZZZ|nr:calcium-translocating P-type ATPase, PMCA-type [uncultured organism]